MKIYSMIHRLKLEQKSTKSAVFFSENAKIALTLKPIATDFVSFFSVYLFYNQKNSNWL